MELRDSYRLYASPAVTRRQWETAIARAMVALPADWCGLMVPVADRLPSVLGVLRAGCSSSAPGPEPVR